MFIRRYVHADWARVHKMARAFHSESPVHSPHPFDEARVWKLLDNASASPDWLPAVVVKEGELIGMMLLFCVPMFFADAFEAGDMCFYVTPEARGGRAAIMMLRHAETWAEQRGATVINIGERTGIRHGTFARFLEKQGYEVTGHVLTRSLP